MALIPLTLGSPDQDELNAPSRGCNSIKHTQKNPYHKTSSAERIACPNHDPGWQVLTGTRTKIKSTCKMFSLSNDSRLFLNHRKTGKNQILFYKKELPALHNKRLYWCGRSTWNTTQEQKLNIETLMWVSLWSSTMQWRVPNSLWSYPFSSVSVWMFSSNAFWLA